jgi:hypothetical protein
MRFLPLTALLSITHHLVQVIAAGPLDCVSPATRPLEDVIDCLDAFTIPEGAFGDRCHNGDDSYRRIQPEKKHPEAWAIMFNSLLDVDGNCDSFALPGALRGIYTVTHYTEPGPGGKSFCIVHETSSTGTPPRYVLGWGLVVVPARRVDVARCIHFSARHPVSDKGTPQQAAALFKLTGAKSLLITGRHRKSFLCPSCQGSEYHSTDVAHSIVKAII